MMAGSPRSDLRWRKCARSLSGQHRHERDEDDRADRNGYEEEPRHTEAKTGTPGEFRYLCGRSPRVAPSSA